MIIDLDREREQRRAAFWFGLWWQAYRSVNMAIVAKSSGDPVPTPYEDLRRVKKWVLKRLARAGLRREKTDAAYAERMVEIRKQRGRK